MKEEDDVNRGGARGYKKMRGGGSVFSPYEFYRIKRWFYADLVVAPQKCTPWLKGPTPPQEFVGRRIGRRWDAARDVILRKFWLPGWQPFLMIVFVKVWYHIFQGLFWGLTLPTRLVIWGIFLARLEFSSSQQNLVIVWLMLLISWNKDLCDHMEKMIKLSLVRLNGNSVICWLTINQLKFSESNQALPEITA